MKWIVFQLITALAVLAIGILLGQISEVRTTARSQKRVRRVLGVSIVRSQQSDHQQ
jgi:hypothetical protein